MKPETLIAVAVLGALVKGLRDDELLKLLYAYTYVKALDALGNHAIRKAVQRLLP